MPHRALATTRKLDTAPGSLNLIETARPFIAMVCEVFVEAVIDVISAKTPEHALTLGKRNNFGQPAATQQASHDESYSVGRQADACHDSPIQSRFNTVEGQSEPSRIAALPGDYPADTDEVEVDVQPLFDPKLPPSAGSEFKPKIGLVSKHADEFEDLQRLYPQLDLTILQANTIADVRRFGHCQRIIALRDDLLPSTDDLLAEQLRHRYVRLSGGLSALKSQLNAWLQMPGSIKAPSGRTGPRNSDASSGGITQKKQNRYPRMIGR
jgi:hypothetical protein